MYTETRSGSEKDESVARKTLDVTVSARAEASPPIDPDPIIVDDSILRVVWRCPDLPPDARLQILFKGDERGPFVLLEPAGSEVIGWGNRGPDETEDRYFYEVALQTSIGFVSIGAGALGNKVTKPIAKPPTTTYDPPGPPDRRDS